MFSYCQLRSVPVALGIAFLSWRNFGGKEKNNRAILCVSARGILSAGTLASLAGIEWRAARTTRCFQEQPSPTSPLLLLPQVREE